MEKLTLKQAIEQGYKYFVYPEDGYQALMDLEHNSEDDVNWNKKPTLCNKDASHPSGMDAEELKVHLADTISDNHAGDTGCDTDDVYEAIMELDFTEMAEKIQERLNGINFYWQSDVELIKLSLSKLYCLHGY
ncbi:hypothetical protein [Chryseobacterium polytrichastri]|uniref:Uncharacterized protein n=1 Tax=Chryseobacterium polytrichastri TaxID=1302687 RepID=A0A1M6VSC5_9FLAO|nr:hypothetical protein [Chryseobacterium polytrichastri]SHK84329.1 hypothetical protein SAMN05444267_1008128 [Chryseobacterium polytrichastri]